jgi:hypothetical protein
MNILSSARISIAMTGVCLDRLLSHLSGKSRAKCARFRNPKSEVRNPKQVKNSNAEIFKRAEGMLSFSAVLIFHQLFRISGLEIRISRQCAWFRLRRVGQRSALRKPDFSFNFPPPRGGLRSLAVGADCIATTPRALPELLS